MEIERAVREDLEELIALYGIVTDQMAEKGLTQWKRDVYPTEEILRQDVEQGNMYVLRTDGRITAACVLSTSVDPEYEGLQWTCGVRPGCFHRLAVHPSTQGAGLGGLVLDDVLQILRRSGCDCVRCDTSGKNDAAVRLYEKLGFRRCDSMRWDDDPGEDYITFDKPLMRETPLWPIPMTPAFRGGVLTPWGGDALRRLYGKDAKEENTGESLEVSCIPGLESRDPMGRKLPDLIREYGEKLVGRYAEEPFPLLLKLIDARDRLSVQVHPNDAYAAAREDGKLGKTEAWLILETPKEGGELIYGVHPGATLQGLREASEQGSAVEKLLNRVRVRPGDVCYIPAGCVHAIGAGIILYEIQQSSDVTYRFYDWDRIGPDGKRRELHLDKALDVTDVRRTAAPKHVQEAFGTKRVLNEEYFTLDVIRPDGPEPLPPVNQFGLLTALRGEVCLRWKGGSLRMKKGDTCFLPRSVPAASLEGNGWAALSMPNG